MANELTASLVGADQLKRALAGVPDKIRKGAMRTALRKGGLVIKRAAQARTPELAVPHPYRLRGTVKRAISVRTSKFARRAGNIGVYVGVRPLSKKKISAFKAGGGGSGYKNPRDPYYWWWLHFGHRIVPRQGKDGVTQYSTRLRNGKVVTRNKAYSGKSITGRRRAAQGYVTGRPFLRQGAQAGFAEATAAIMAEAVPAIERLNAKAAG